MIPCRIRVGGAGGRDRAGVVADGAVPQVPLRASAVVAAGKPRRIAWRKPSVRIEAGNRTFIEFHDAAEAALADLLTTGEGQSIGPLVLHIAPKLAG